MVMTIPDVGLKPCKYRYGELGRGITNIYIEERDNDVWAITRGNSTLNRDFEWEYEPMPSGRDDDYLKRNRFTFEEAVNHLANAITEGKLDEYR